MTQAVAQPEEKSITEGRSYRGVSFFVTLKKSPAGLYRASAEVLFSTHHERVDFHDGTWAMADSKGCAMLRKNQGLKGNPFTAAEKQLHGLIDARLGQLAVLEKTRLECNTGGSSAIVAESLSDSDAQKLKTLLSIIKESTDTMRPNTDPTPDEIQTMKAQTEALIARFTVAGLSAISGIPYPTVGQWKIRGRVGASAANEICKLEQVKAAGFTRENLRPDVKFWYID